MLMLRDGESEGLHGNQQRKGKRMSTLRVKRCDVFRWVFLVCIFLLVREIPVWAADIVVPDNYPKIQQAIDAAQPGDRVVVKNNIYTGEGNTNLDFKGKAITVTSLSGPSGCIIDGESMNRGFIFHSGEGRGSVLSGFTIRGGYSATNPNDPYGKNGGAIVVESASPTIANCILTNNQANSGGAIYMLGGSPLIEGCTFSGNYANDAINSGGYGGAIYCYIDSSPVITNCLIDSNRSTLEGGGIAAIVSSPQITSCTFSKNKSQFGGGLANDSSSPSVVNSIFNANEASTTGGGGGIVNIFASPTFLNCTIVTNTGEGAANYTAHPSFTNCIIWSNTRDEIKLDTSSTATVINSDVEGGFAGTGNINQNPLFRSSSDFHLQETSPCIDKGSNVEGLPAADRDGAPRIINNTVDMGAYEYGGALVSMSSTDLLASEPGVNKAKFTITRKGDLYAPFNVYLQYGGTAARGTDYQKIPLTATIPAGSAVKILGIVPLDDDESESDETADISIIPKANYLIGTESQVSIVIKDNDTLVSITSSDTNASEPGSNKARFTITRTAIDISADLRVKVQLTGTALNGQDYKAISSQLLIPANIASKTFVITPLDDVAVEGTEQVIITVLAGDYYKVEAPGTVTINIADNE